MKHYSYALFICTYVCICIYVHVEMSWKSNRQNFWKVEFQKTFLSIVFLFIVLSILWIVSQLNFIIFSQNDKLKKLEFKQFKKTKHTSTVSYTCRKFPNTLIHVSPGNEKGHVSFLFYRWGNWGFPGWLESTPTLLRVAKPSLKLRFGVWSPSSPYLLLDDFSSLIPVIFLFILMGFQNKKLKKNGIPVL